MATQNPIEQEGTYPLPEAQLDRFFFKLVVGYSSREELGTIVDRTTRGERIEARKVMDGAEILQWQQLVREVIIAPHVQDYIVRLVLATHPEGPLAPPITNQYLRWGASPRGAQALALAAKVRALLEGRYNVSFEDVRRVYLPAMRHRVILNFEAQAEADRHRSRAARDSGKSCPRRPSEPTRRHGGVLRHVALLDHGHRSARCSVPNSWRSFERLELVSRKIFRGRMKGERRSTRKGQSVEFADFRSYVPGDDLRFIDWNTYARLDRLFLKMFFEEEDLHFYALIDASPSMAFGTPTKLRYAEQLAAALGFHRPDSVRSGPDRNARPAGRTCRRRLSRPARACGGCSTTRRHRANRERLAAQPRRQELLHPQHWQGHRASSSAT